MLLTIEWVLALRVFEQGINSFPPFSLTQSVLSESLEKEVSVIVAYHPTIFKGLQSITLGNPLQASLLKCAAEGISVYSPHSALDSVWGGINDWLAEGLMGTREGGEVKHLVGEKLHPGTGLSEGGEGRLVTLHEPIGFEKLVERVKSHLKLSQRQFPPLINSSFFLMDSPCFSRYHGSVLLFPSSSWAFSNNWDPIIRCTYCCYLRWFRWVYARRETGGRIPHGRNVSCRCFNHLHKSWFHITQLWRSQHEVLAAVEAGKHVILCKSTI